MDNVNNSHSSQGSTRSRKRNLFAKQQGDSKKLKTAETRVVTDNAEADSEFVINAEESQPIEFVEENQRTSMQVQSGHDSEDENPSQSDEESEAEMETDNESKTRESSQRSTESAEKSDEDDDEQSQRSRQNSQSPRVKGKHKSRRKALTSSLASSSNSDSDQEMSDDSQPQRKHKKKKMKSGKRKHRKSMENKIDMLSNSVLAMQNMMAQKGFFGEPGTSGGSSHTAKKNNNQGNSTLLSSNSETTIYKNAVDKIQDMEVEQEYVDNEITFQHKSKRDSSSSEDKRVDTSDELVDYDINDQFIADCVQEAECR